MLRVEIKADSRFPVNRARVRETVAKLLQKYRVQGEIEVSLAVVGDRKMTELNKEYMKCKGTTDVLSFPFQDPNSQPNEGAGFMEPPDERLRLGDIVVSFPQAVKQAREKNILVDQEIDNLVMHGMEHLLGRHHE